MTQNFMDLCDRYDGPIPKKLRLRALLNLEGQRSDRFEYALASTWIKHLSLECAFIIKEISKLGHDAISKFCRQYYRQELVSLLHQRRDWKVYRRSKDDCRAV